MSKITQFSYWQNIDSHITVKNEDGTTVTFTTPSNGKTFEQVHDELVTVAEAYISAFENKNTKVSDNG